MSASMPDMQAFDTREGASVAAADHIVSSLKRGVETRGTARLLLSGGSTPKTMLGALSGMGKELWPKVTIGLADERWVDVSSEASNERLVRDHLLVSQAASARFVSMRTGQSEIEDAAVEASRDYAELLASPDMVVLGVGPDGHTASWFPGSDSLRAAVNRERTPAVLAVDASGCPVAGEDTQRLTINLPYLETAKAAILLMFGEDKRDVFAEALKADAADFPIQYAVTALQERLHIYWAP